MALTAPLVKFIKAAGGLTADTGLANTAAVAAAVAADMDIGYGVVGGAGQPDEWMHKAVDADIPGETALWTTIPPAVYATVKSGVGFIDSGGTQKEIIQGGVSGTVNLLITNNQGHTAGVAVCENSTLCVFDGPFLATQALEPIVNDDVGGKHKFWLRVKAVKHWCYSAPNWIADPAGDRNSTDPFCLGKGETYPGGSAPYEPIECVAAAPWTSYGSPDGVGRLPVGSLVNGFLGAPDGFAGVGTTGCDGGCLDIQLRLLVPTDATAMIHKFAMAIEYTYVVA